MSNRLPGMGARDECRSGMAQARHPFSFAWFGGPALGLVLHNVARLAGLGLSKTLANELGRHGITVNAVGIGSFEGHPDETETGARRRYNAAAALNGRT